MFKDLYINICIYSIAYVQIFYETYYQNRIDDDDDDVSAFDGKGVNHH